MARRAELALDGRGENLDLAARREEPLALVGGIERLGGGIPTGMIEVERADSGVLCRRTGPADWLGGLFEAFLGHAAHSGSVGDELGPELAVVPPFQWEGVLPVGG